MSKKTNELAWRCQLIEHKISGIEDRLDDLARVIKSINRDFNRMVDARINENTRVMVVDSLAAYKKGKAIKKQVDYISKVLKGDD